MKYNVTFTDWKTKEKTTTTLSNKGLELCDYFAHHGGLCLVEGKGYFYNLEDLQDALNKLSKTDGWEYFKNY